MVSRRDALKLSAAGLAATTLFTGCGAASEELPKEPTQVPTPTEIPVAKGTPTGEKQIPDGITSVNETGVVTAQANAARTGEMMGPGPSMDYPIIVRWKVEHFDNTRASPLVHNDKVILPISTDVVCFELESGKEVWRFSAGENNGRDPVYTTPTLAEGVVYAGNNSNKIFAIDAETGEGIWQSNVGSAVHGSPTVVDGVVYSSTLRGGPDDSGRVIALNAATGDEIWRFALGESTHEPVAIHDDQVIAVCEDGIVYALDSLTGSENWRFQTGGEIRSPASIANNKVFVPSDDGNLYALALETGDEIWRFSTGDKIQATPAIMNGVAYFGSYDCNLYAVNAVDGREIWRSPWTTAFLSLYSAGVTEDVAYWSTIAIDKYTGETLYGEMWQHGETARPSTSAVYRDYLLAVMSNSLVCIGNLKPTQISQEAVLRGAPSPSGVSLGNLKVGDRVTSILLQEERNGQTWAQVVVSGDTGWIPLDAIDPSTLPPEGEIEYVYVP